MNTKKILGVVAVLALVAVALVGAGAADGSATLQDTSVASVTNGTTTTYYDTLEEALDAVQAEGKITLLTDVTGNFVVNQGFKFTIDLDDHTLYLGPGLGSSAATSTAGMYIGHPRDGHDYATDVTVKNGDVVMGSGTAASKTREAFMNYCNLTLDSVNVSTNTTQGPNDGTLFSVINYGKLTLAGDTKLTDGTSVGKATGNNTILGSVSMGFYTNADMVPKLIISDADVTVGKIVINGDWSANPAVFTSPMVIDETRGTVGDIVVNYTAGMTDCIGNNAITVDATGNEANVGKNCIPVAVGVELQDKSGNWVPVPSTYYKTIEAAISNVTNTDDTICIMNDYTHNGNLTLGMGVPSDYYMSTAVGSTLTVTGNLVCNDNTTFSPNAKIYVGGTLAVKGSIVNEISNPDDVSFIGLNGNGCGILEIEESQVEYLTSSNSLLSAIRGNQICTESNTYTFTSDYTTPGQPLTDYVKVTAAGQSTPVTLNTSATTYTFTIPVGVDLNSTENGHSEVYEVSIKVISGKLNDQLAVKLDTKADRVVSDVDQFAVSNSSGYKAYYQVEKYDSTQQNPYTPIGGKGTTMSAGNTVFSMTVTGNTESQTGYVTFETMELPTIVGTYTGTLNFVLDVTSA